MRKITVELCSKVIELGRYGENEATAVYLPLAEFQNYTPGGTFSVLVRRPDVTEPSPVSFTVEGSYAIWVVGEDQLAVEGYGEVELRYVIGETRALSRVWSTRIGKSLLPVGDTPPDPFESWYENIVAAGDRAEDFKNAAKAYSEAAQTAAEGAAEAKRLSEEYAAAAFEHRNAAEDFKNAAENAASEAEKAENEAKAAAESAKADKSAAAASAQVAESAKQAALASENAAKAAQEAANASAIAAGGYASEAVDAANAAGGYASNASQYADAAGRYANAAAGYASQAQRSAEAAAQSAQSAAASERNASLSETNAAESERQAGLSKEAIENMGALAQTTAPGSAATVTKTVAPDGTVTLEFGIPRGDKGDKGDDYVLTQADKEEIAGMVDVPVSDVQVNGTSIVTDGVANVPKASANEFGVVRVETYYGLSILGSGILCVTAATDAQIKAESHQFRPITPNSQHLSAFYGLAKAAGDTTQSQSANAVGQYTEAAKSAISEMLNGAVTVEGTTPTINALSGVRYVCGEVSTLDITLPTSGIVDVTFESGSTPTVLTITPPTGVTLKWANDFDPTSLEANTIYELNIMDGIGVAVGVSA